MPTELRNINLYNQPIRALRNDDGSYSVAIVAVNGSGDPVGDSATGQVTNENDLQNSGTSTASTTNAGRGVNYTVTVSNLVSTINVRVEGSLDNSNWFNMDDNDNDFEITTNGTYSFTTDDPRVPHFRFTFVSGVADLQIQSVK